jgi:GNAT superfamily N-acetyltransferase
VAQVALEDGTRLELRPLGPEDKDGLAAGFRRLSARSRYRRFLSPTPQLSARQLAYLTEVDHRDHEALVAVEPSSRDGLAVARYVRSREHPEQAEFAVAVADDWQRRGLGTVLLRHLAARAREEGITSFTGVALADNLPARRLLERLGPVRLLGAHDGTVEVSLEIPEDPLADEHGQLASWMRAAAAGALDTRLREPAAGSRTGA